MNKFTEMLERFKSANNARLDLQSRELEALRLFALWLDDEALKEKQWRHVYEKRLMSRGYTREDAFESAQAAEYIHDVEPDEAADDEVSYEMTS
jgi:hypothetical protein